MKLGWDDPVPEQKKIVWVELLKLQKAADKIRFKRCVSNEESVEIHNSLSSVMEHHVKLCALLLTSDGN